MKEKSSGRGMPYFEKEHWQKNVEDVSVANGKYGTEFGNAEDLKKSVDGLANYAKKHRAKH